MAFKDLGEILTEAKRRNPLFGRRMAEAEALSRWEEAVGTNISRHSRAISINKGVILVEVDHPIWKAELHHRKGQILSILNQVESGKRTLIKDIFFLDPK